MIDFNSLENILNFAIDQEQQAVDFYNDLAIRAKNEAMKKIFIEFAQEEMAHKAKLIEIKNLGILTIEKTDISDLKIADYIVKSDNQGELTYQDALVLAMKKEKAAFKLYFNLSQKANNTQIKELFMMLAQEESKHKLRFEVEYDEFVLKEN